MRADRSIVRLQATKRQYFRRWRCYEANGIFAPCSAISSGIARHKGRDKKISQGIFLDQFPPDLAEYVESVRLFPMQRVQFLNKIT